MKMKLILGLVLIFSLALFVGNVFAQEAQNDDDLTGFVVVDDTGMTLLGGTPPCGQCGQGDCCDFDDWSGDDHDFDRKGGEINNDCNKDRCVYLHITAQVKQWAYLHLSDTRFEWTIYKPGKYIEFLTQMCTLSNGETSLKWAYIGNLTKPDERDINVYYMAKSQNRTPGWYDHGWVSYGTATIAKNQPACCHKWYIFSKMEVDYDHQGVGEYCGKAKICLTLNENKGAFGSIDINPV